MRWRGWRYLRAYLRRKRVQSYLLACVSIWFYFWEIDPVEVSEQIGQIIATIAIIWNAVGQLVARVSLVEPAEVLAAAEPQTRKTVKPKTR